MVPHPSGHNDWTMCGQVDMYKTNYSPSLGFSRMMVRLFCKQNISSVRKNEVTTQKEADPRVLVISFEFLDLGIRTPLPTLHSPHVFFSSVILGCVLVIN